jgi:HSP90 family molecular chaperone
MVLGSENSMEAIRAVQRDKKEFGLGAAYHGTIQINFDFDLSQIEIRDNGRGMSDSDVRNAVNYGRLKNRIANNGVIREKVNKIDAYLAGSKTDY